MPLQLPWLPVSTWPRCGVPTNAGAVVATGGDAGTVIVAALAAPAVPSGLAAVTITRRALASSAWLTT